MGDVTLHGKLEALLFLYGEPVAVRKLADVLGVKEPEIETALGELEAALVDGKRGLFIVRSGERVQLTTKPVLGDLLSKIAEDELDTGLTPASVETLSIVAYLGPCRRSLVEHVRGVNSSFMLRSLMIRGLIEREPDPKRANTFLYRVTFDFLRHMGVSRVEELPEYEKYREFAELFTNPHREPRVVEYET